MAGNVTGLHRFADDVGPVPLSLLDTNFDALTLAINTLNTFSNFYVDTGTTNALTITPPSTQSVSYGDGLIVSVRVAATNTGPSTLNIGTLGPQPIQTSAGAALTGGELQAGSITDFVYNASRNAWQLKPGGGGGGGGGVSTFSTPFTVNDTAGQSVFQVRDGAAANQVGTGIVTMSPGNATDPARVLCLNGMPGYDVFVVSGATNTTQAAWLAQFTASPTSTPGSCEGVRIAAGLSNADISFGVYPANVNNSTGLPSYFQILGNGSGSLGPYPNQLVWNAAGQFSLTGSATLPGGGGGTGVSYLSQLLDVSLTSPANAQVLTWNGTTSRWTNQVVPVPALSTLPDVSVSGQVQGQVLSWNSTSNRWTNMTVSGGGGGSGVAPFTISDPVTTANPFFAVPSAGGATVYAPHNSVGQSLLVEGAVNPQGTGSAPGSVMLIAGGTVTTASQWLLDLQNFTASAGCSNGLLIISGTNASDSALTIQNQAGTSTFLNIHGDGTGALGASANNMTWNSSGFTFTSTNPAVNPLTVVVPPSTTAGNWLWRIGGPGASGSSVGCSNALVVAGGTNSADNALLVQNDGSTKTFLSLKGDGSGAIGPSPNQLVWSTTGAFTLTGTATLPGGSGGTNVAPFKVNDTTGGPLLSVAIPASGANTITMSPGNVGLGTVLEVNGAVNATVMNVAGAQNTAINSWLASFHSGTAAGFSNGVFIQAGTNANDICFMAEPAAGGYQYMTVRGDGLTVHRYSPFIAQGSWQMQLGGGTSGNATGCSNGLYIGAGTSVNDCPLWVQNDAGTTTYMQILGDGTGSLGPGANAMKWDASGDLTMAAGARIIGLIFPVVYTLANVTTVPIGVNFMATAPFTIPANFAASRAYAQTGPAVAQTWNIRQYVGGVAPGNLIGTVTFAINATSGAFSSSSATTLSSGDVLALIPTTDTAMAGISVNIWTTRA